MITIIYLSTVGSAVGGAGQEAVGLARRVGAEVGGVGGLRGGRGPRQPARGRALARRPRRRAQRQRVQRHVQARRQQSRRVRQERRHRARRRPRARFLLPARLDQPLADNMHQRYIYMYI